MTARCPGQDGRDLSASLHRCPFCGAEVEMFSDEIRVRCHACRRYVCKDTVPSCVEWCAKARECLGEERWQALYGTAAEVAEVEASGEGGPDA